MIGRKKALTIATAHNLPDPAAELLAGHEPDEAERLAAWLEAERERNAPKPPPVNFDGGPRQHVPAPVDPLDAHNRAVVELLLGEQTEAVLE